MVGKVMFWMSALFWTVMMGLFIRLDVLPAYREASAPGYGHLVKSIQEPVTRKMAVLFKNEEVGTSDTVIIPMPDGTFEIKNITKIQVNSLMINTTVLANLTMNLDARKELTTMSLLMSYGGTRFNLDGRRQADKMLLDVGIGAEKPFRVTMPYENGLVASYFEPFALGSRLRVGQAWQTRYIDPLKQKYSNAEIKVTGREKIAIRLKASEPPREIDAYTVVMTAGTMELKAWATAEGEILREETPLGYVLEYRESD